MITNKTIAERTARRLVDYLTSKGIKAESDFRFAPIRKVLRDCYYVEKVLECGHTDCLHVGLPDVGSFFAVLEDGRLMSGCHVMIADAVSSIFLEYVDSDVSQLGDAILTMADQLCHDEDERAMYVVSFDKFKAWLDSVYDGSADGGAEPDDVELFKRQ